MKFLTKLLVAITLLSPCLAAFADGDIYAEGVDINRTKLAKIAKDYNIPYDNGINIGGYILRYRVFMLQTYRDKEDGDDKDKEHRRVDLILKDTTAVDAFKAALDAAGNGSGTKFYEWDGDYHAIFLAHLEYHPSNGINFVRIRHDYIENSVNRKPWDSE